MSDKPVKRLPMLPLRGLTIFPYLVLHFDVGACPIHCSFGRSYGK